MGLHGKPRRVVALQLSTERDVDFPNHGQDRRTGRDLATQASLGDGDHACGLIAAVATVMKTLDLRCCAVCVAKQARWPSALLQNLLFVHICAARAQTFCC